MIRLTPDLQEQFNEVASRAAEKLSTGQRKLLVAPSTSGGLWLKADGLDWPGAGPHPFSNVPRLLAVYAYFTDPDYQILYEEEWKAHGLPGFISTGLLDTLLDMEQRKEQEFRIPARTREQIQGNNVVISTDEYQRRIKPVIQEKKKAMDAYLEQHADRLMTELVGIMQALLGE